MIQMLIEYPLLLLFTVASLGYLIGSLKIRGSSLGVAAVLFTGLAFGAMDARLQIPQIIFLLGLSIYVYSIGLSSGPSFFASYQKNGVRDFIFTTSMLLFSGLVAAFLWLLFGFSAATITGIYAGSTTNTPALAGVLDYINNAFPNEGESLINQAVIGYSFSYPMGVLGGIIGIVLMEKILKIDYKKEQEALKDEYPSGESLSTTIVEVTNNEIADTQLRDLHKKYDWNVNFGRLLHNGELSLVSWDTRFEVGDVVMVLGNKDSSNAVVEMLGKRVDSQMAYDRKEFDVRQIFVSNPMLIGRSLASLNISEKYNAIVTRIRRGDMDFLAKADTVLELGDRIRFIARREDLAELSKYFGDSYRDSSRVNLFSFGLGIGLGLILGSIEFSFGDTLNFKLGYAGGPLIVGLILGTLRRTGPIVWSLPYSANVTLQQLGLILLLAVIGVSSGRALVENLSIESLWIFLASGMISLLTAFAILFVGYKVVKMPFSLLLGVVSNQPAILDFATSRSQNRIPVFGYVMMFPIALIFKIVIAQVLFSLLN